MYVILFARMASDDDDNGDDDDGAYDDDDDDDDELFLRNKWLTNWHLPAQY